MNSELIICTKDRVNDLERCLISVFGQDVIPSKILIVDASNCNGTKELCNKYSDRLPLVWLRCAPGLTKQRNYGLKNLLPETEIVHFIDDDVVLHENYFSAIERVFEGDHCDRVGGAGGIVENIQTAATTIAHRFFLLDSLRKGVVLSSFKNTIVYDAISDTPVEWLRGCTMSYRRAVFNTFEFDGNLSGYSLGEDVDFSYRVSRKFILILTPDARMVHNRSIAGRQSDKDWHRSETVHRYYYVKKNLKRRNNTAAFWWSVFGWAAINGALAIVKFSRWYLRNTFGIVLGAKDILTRNHELLKGRSHKHVRPLTQTASE